MSPEQEVRDFLRDLPGRRALLPDGQILDECQAHLAKLVAVIEQLKEPAWHSGQGPKLESNEIPGTVIDFPPSKKRSHHKKVVPHKR